MANSIKIKQEVFAKFLRKLRFEKNRLNLEILIMGDSSEDEVAETPEAAAKFRAGPWRMEPSLERPRELGELAWTGQPRGCVRCGFASARARE